MTPLEACARFPAVGVATAAVPLGGGHIHDSWMVDSDRGRWVVQRCNTRIFTDLRATMDNIAVVCDAVSPELRPLPTADGGSLWEDSGGGVWRVRPFVPGAVARFDGDVFSVRALGRGLGAFHRRVAAVDPSCLTVTFPHFHDVAARLDDLDAAARASTLDAVKALERVDAYRWLAEAGAAMTPPSVPTRVAHFDAKASNMVVDVDTGEVVAVVDLDTVMPGSWLWDVGDLVRSTATGAPEDIGRPAAPLRVAALLDGYLSEAGDLLTPIERSLVDGAAAVVTFEQAVRFLTDHLAGDRYYGAKFAGHNLTRAEAQLALLDSLPSTMIRLP